MAKVVRRWVKTDARCPECGTLQGSTDFAIRLVWVCYKCGHEWVE